ncbi:hypothetical protein ACG873_20560 [Mesorhizobium sp. AaZ16]|uniref:hypothetical protein n=1 Tax=Mesorhizobium sp. AaZ16 TaxID=3402289 RepID=UPI00374F6F7A
MSAAEPGRRYWAIAVIASLALHAGAAGAAAMLFETYRRDAVRTDFIFSDAPASAVAPVAPAAERVAAVQVRSEAVERIAPMASERVNAREIATAVAVQRELAQPVAPSRAETAAAATLRPSSAVATIAEERADRAAEPISSARLSRVSPASAARLEPTATEVAAAAVIAVESVLASDQPALSPSTSVLAETVAAERESASPVQSPSAVAPATTNAARTEQTPSRATQEVAALARPTQRIPAAAERLSPAVPPRRLEAIRPAEPPLQTALLTPERPDSSSAERVAPQPDPYRDAVDFIRRFDGGDCFAALPTRHDKVEFRTFGTEASRHVDFARAYAKISGAPANIRSGELAEAQCQALGFIRKSDGYPEFSLSLRLDTPEVPSGTVLSGSILDAGEQKVHLLLVDDEGRVQLADEFISAASRTERRFSLPVFLTGGPVRTQQLLIAIASDRAVPMLRNEVDQPAGEFFARLARQVAASDAELNIAVEAFSVR